MPKRKYFRRIYVDEWAEASNKLTVKYPDGVLPDWRNVWVQVESVEGCECSKQEKILALVEFEQRTCINTLDADSPVAARDIINWADGYLANFPQYEFAVPDSNKKMQKALLRHFGLEGETEPTHKVYIIRRQ